jgi:multisubunit Na+/H+ antiporter MnhG subunit
MSDPFIDMVIFILLVLSVGFGGIGIIGLLLFPDIRSRMYTAFRATSISISTMVFSVIIYALYTIQIIRSDQYNTLILHSIILLCVVFVGNIVLYKTILDRTKTAGTCRLISDRNNKKNEE